MMKMMKKMVDGRVVGWNRRGGEWPRRRAGGGGQVATTADESHEEWRCEHRHLPSYLEILGVGF